MTANPPENPAKKEPIEITVPEWLKADKVYYLTIEKEMREIKFIRQENTLLLDTSIIDKRGIFLLHAYIREYS
jgi:hypothetical protein